MDSWNNPVVPTAFSLLLLLLVGEGLRALLPALRRAAIPASILAGAVGLFLGPSALDMLPVDIDVLEAGVYHALAVVFIAVSLQAPKGAAPGRSARAMAFAIASMTSLQTAVGLLGVLLIGVGMGAVVHPGFGLLLPLGFEQGPGQALAMGNAWEQAGLVDGGQVGLIIAAVGFAWSVLVGIPFVAWGKRRGLWQPSVARVAVDQPEEVAPSRGGAGGLDLLTRQVAGVGTVYAATWLVCTGLAAALASLPEVAAMIWGFHFMVGALLSIGLRAALNAGSIAHPFNDALLGRVASFTVDLATVAALTAVQLAVLRANWLPIAVLTTLGGVATVFACLWIGRRGFPEAGFEHAVVWFGMSTGTLPMGLALLRIVDPELRSPAPVSVVLGSSMAIVPLIPLVLVVQPATIALFGTYGVWATVGGLLTSLLFLAVTLVVWVNFAGFQWRLRGGVWPAEEP